MNSLAIGCQKLLDRLIDSTVGASALRTDVKRAPVDGVDGVILEDTYEGGNARFTLLWVKDGIFYALSGDGTRYSPVRIGNSME